MGFFKPNIEKMREKRDVQGLMKLLSDKDHGVKLNALQALFRLGLAGDLLIAAMTQKAWPFCDCLIGQLFSTPDSNAIGPLIAVLTDLSCPYGTAKSAVQVLDKLDWKPVRLEDAPPYYIRFKIQEYMATGQADVCVQIGEPLIPHLLELLRNTRSSLSLERADICDVLKRIGEPAVEPLIAAVGSNSNNECFDIDLVGILGQINHPRVLPFLMNMSGKDVKRAVRNAAIEALGNRGRDAVCAVDTLLNIVKTEGKIPDCIVNEMKLPINKLSSSNDDDEGRSGFGSAPFDYTPWTTDIRILAVTALRKIADLRAVEALIILYNTDWNWYVRSATIQALGKIDGSRAVDVAMSALNGCLKIDNEYPRERTRGELQTILGTLGSVRDSRAVDLLMGYFKKGTERECVSDALVNLYGLLGDVDKIRIREALFLMLPDFQAAITLGKIGDERALPFLLPHLIGCNSSLTVPVIKNIGLAATPFLIDILRDHADIRIRNIAASILGQIKDVLSFEALVNALKDEDWSVRSVAAAALGKFDEPPASAVPALIAHVSINYAEGKYGDSRQEAADCLGKIGHPQAVDALLAMAQDEQGFMGHAVRALGEIAKKSSDPDLRTKIKSSLKIISSNRELQSHDFKFTASERDNNNLLHKNIEKILKDLEAGK